MPSIKLEPIAAKRLVRLLASDDGFRELFVSDTSTALRTAGYIPENSTELDAFVTLCCADVKLASKEVISGAEQEIFAMLTSGTGYSVPMLEAGRQTRILNEDAASETKAA